MLTDILKQTLASRYKSPSNPEETQVSQSSASILNGIVFNAKVFKFFEETTYHIIEFYHPVRIEADACASNG